MKSIKEEFTELIKGIGAVYGMIFLVVFLGGLAVFLLGIITVLLGFFESVFDFGMFAYEFITPLYETALEKGALLWKEHPFWMMLLLVCYLFVICLLPLVHHLQYRIIIYRPQNEQEWKKKTH